MIIDHTMVHPDADISYLRGKLPETLIEHAARTCYRSMDKFGTNPDFIKKLIQVKHLDVLEHVYFSVEIEVKRPQDLYVWFYKMTHYYPYAHIEIINGLHRVSISANLRVWYEFSIDKSLISGIMEPTQSELLWYYLWYIAPHVFDVPIFNNELDQQCHDIYLEMYDKVDKGIKSFVNVGPSTVKLLGWCENHATVEYNNISRSCHNQIVRHRRMSHSAESLRYCEPGENTLFIVPDKCDLETAKRMGIHYRETIELYNLLREHYKLRKEDARAILPLNVSTNQVISGDRWAWDVFFEQRCAKDAQKEIRDLAIATRELLQSTGMF